MTEHPQHANAVQILGERLPPGTIIRTNNDVRGIGGWTFPRCFNGKSAEPVQYIADRFVILPDGRPVILEVDGNKSGQGHFSDRAVMGDNFRDAFFHNYGIVTVRYPTPWVKDLTESDIMADINYKTYELRKKLLTSCATAPRLTTA